MHVFTNVNDYSHSPTGKPVPFKSLFTHGGRHYLYTSRSQPAKGTNGWRAVSMTSEVAARGWLVCSRGVVVTANSGIAPMKERAAPMTSSVVACDWFDCVTWCRRRCMAAPRWAPKLLQDSCSGLEE